MQRSGNSDDDPQMKGKPTFNRHEDVCAIEVLTHKMITLVLNDSVRYASTIPPPRDNFTPAERAGGIHQIRGWVGHVACLGVVVWRKNMQHIVESNHVYIV
jgi:hypothetical protein